MSRSELALVVLAAGMGSRFGGPKQVEPVGPSGEILLDYSVFDALAAGFTHVVFVVREDVEPVLRARLGPVLAGRCRVDFVLQRVSDVPASCAVPQTRTKPWGTGQAVLACRDAVSGPFAVVNADDFYGAPAYSTVARFLSRASGSPQTRNALVGYHLGATLTEHGAVSRGLCELNPCGRLTSIAERHGVARREDGVGFRDEAGAWRFVPDDSCASMNFWGLDPTVFPLLEQEFCAFLSSDPAERDEFRLPTGVGQLIARNAMEVHVLRTNAVWLGVTHREDLEWVRAALRDKVEKGEYPSPLWEPASRDRDERSRRG